MEARTQYDAVKAFAWDAANQDLLELEAADPGVAAPGNVAASDLAAVVGLDAFDLRHAGQVKDEELQAWADAELLRSRLAQVRGRVRAQGFGEVAPGNLIELGGVGDRFNGTVLVWGVQHEINVENWETNIEFGMPPEGHAARTDDVAEQPAGGLLPPVTGLQVGLVTALEGDPDGAFRVQVRIPAVNKDDEGIWARVSLLDAGDGRSTFFLPEVGDEVILGFLNDDPRNPVILGGVHSSAKPPPIDPSDDNHEKGIVTRSGMKFVFNDEKKSVTLETPNANKLEISDDEGAISLTDESGNTYKMSSDGITIESAKDILIKASGNVKIEGTNVESAANGQFKAEGSGGAEMSSSATTVVKGSLVQIN